MKNEEQKIENQQDNLVLPCVNSGKLERIEQTKKLIEEGKILFDPMKHENDKNFIISCDVANGKDWGIKHVFRYR